MSKLIISLTLLTTMLCQNTITLNKVPTKSIQFSLTHELTIDDDELGLYRQTNTTILDDGSIVIYDVGNQTFHKFNSEGRLLKTKKWLGNGPGEISRPLMQFLSYKDRLIAKESFKIHIYDSELNHVADVKLKMSSDLGTVIVQNDKIIVKYEKAISETAYVYDLDGKHIHTVKNLNKSRASEKFRGFAWNGKIYYKPFQDKIIQFKDGLYSFFILNSEFKKLSAYTKSFDRIENPYFDEEIKWYNEAIKPKKDVTSSFVSDKTTKFLNDIVQILGSYKNYLFIQTASETGIHIDIIKDLTEYVYKLEIEPDVKARINYSRIVGNKLILNLVNDDIGAYVMIYSIKLES